MAKQKNSAGKSNARGTASGKPRLYTLEVVLLDGQYTQKFAKKNPVVSQVNRSESRKS